MKKVKFGIVGLGHIGKRHAEMIQRNPDAELVAIADILSDKQLNYTFPNIPLYKNLTDMLNG